MNSSPTHKVYFNLEKVTNTKYTVQISQICGILRSVAAIVVSKSHAHVSRARRVMQGRHVRVGRGGVGRQVSIHFGVHHVSGRHQVVDGEGVRKVGRCHVHLRHRLRVL